MYRALILLGGCLLISQAGYSQRRYVTGKPYQEWSRFSFEFGGYLANISSTFRLGADNLGIGLDINFEQALGLETTSFTYYGKFLYRFSKNRRHSVRAQYSEITRKATKIIRADIEIYDRVFSKGTELGSRFSLSVLNVDYSYSFLLDERININASFGFFVMPIKVSVRQDDKKAEQTDFVAPLPAIGIESHILLTNKISLRQGIHLFYLKLDKLQGRMADLGIMVQYNPIPHLGFGIGFNAFTIDVTQEKTGRPFFGDLVGNIGYKHSGLLLNSAFTF